MTWSHHETWSYHEKWNTWIYTRRGTPREVKCHDTWLLHGDGRGLAAKHKKSTKLILYYVLVPSSAMSTKACEKFDFGSKTKKILVVMGTTISL